MKNKFPTVSFILLIVLSAVALLASLLLAEYDTVIGIILLVTAIITAVAFAVEMFFFSRNTIKHVSRMNTHLENSTAEYINSLPSPVAVIDSSKKIIWYNNSFSEKISADHDIYGMDTCDIKHINFGSLTEKGGICAVGTDTYKVTSEKFEKNDVSLYILFFQDETQYIYLKNKLKDTQPNVVIITVDNYDEILQNAKESEKALVSVEVEKLIENFMSTTNGFVRKSNSNTFCAVIERRHLDEIIAGKFKILESARSIKIAGKYPLTLSIGVGLGADSLSESEKIAKQCLDMALGRGGDQATVKTENGFEFFGGVSKGIEKKSRAKTRILANALQDVVMNSDKVFIMGHRFGDFDSVGASCGMAGAVEMLGKEVHIAVYRDRNLASNLIDMVEENTNSELFVTPEYAVEEITEKDLLIVVDTHSKDCLESSELYNRAKTVVVIDHHRKTACYIDNAVIFHHEPHASSASEMVTEIIQYFNFPSDERLPNFHADALLSGIMLDTKNFVMRTGVRTFEAGAFLKKLGADTVTVKLLFSGTIDLYKRKSRIVSSTEVYKKCAIATADFESDDIRIAGPQAADELLSITDVNASFVLYRTGSTVNISARSLGAVNVQVIMEKLGGGGHQTMAATQIKDISEDDAIEKLKSAIDEVGISEEE
ncbi:MAG: DHH family phosphoesterase [Ruminococcus sp.]|nr:DHH family phosphoesterase [Ruminococcus sp.]